MMIHCTFSRIIFLALLLALGFPFRLSAEPLTPVSLQLRWLHQFQFAGYYAALHKGFYREAGLDVTLKEGGPGADPVQEVLSGRSEFGIALSSLVVNFLKGQPVLLLGPIFQHSPNVLLVSGRDRRLVDLARPDRPKIAMMGSDQDVDLRSMFINEGIELDRLNFVPDKHHLNDLLNRRVEALNAYTSNEPFLLDQRGVPYTILKPSTYGMDFYGDLLFTHQDMEKSHPQVVAAFYAASKRGWQYALDHPREIIDLIWERYNTQHKSHEHLAFEAMELHKLINPEVIEIGHNNPGRWRHIASTYAFFGVVDDNQPLDGFFYQPDRRVDLTWVYWSLAALAGLTSVVGSIAFYIHRINRRLAIANQKLSELSVTDGLTNIANRRHFDTILTQELARHARSGELLSLILLDIDHFKAFNDNYGHVKGDECLRLIGQVLRESAIRPADLAARYGGEEFACILPETDCHGAIILAEKIRNGIEALAIPHKASTAAACVTASLGVITVQCSADESADDLLARADGLLYRAKSSGRNRVEFDVAQKISSKSASDETDGNVISLVWKESFNSGNILIDAQHQSLFNVANDLMEALLTGRPSDEIAALMGQLFDDVSQHFQDEQTILETINFPGVSQHIEEHTRLLEKAVELSEQCKAGTLAVGNLFQFLASDVINGHLFGADFDYFPFIREAANTK